MRYQILSLLVAMALAASCDAKKSESATATGDDPKTATAPEGTSTKTDDRGPIALGGVKVQASAHALRFEGAPTAKELEASLRDELYTLPSFAKDGQRQARGLVTFDIRNEEVDGKKRVEVILFGSIEDGSNMGRKFSAEVFVTNANQPAMLVQELIAMAMQRYAKRIDGQARVAAATDDELVTLLSDEKEDATVRLVAVQEARDRRLVEAKEPARKLLASPDERLKVASAAALVALKDEASYSEIIGIAETMSRERNRQLMPLLYLIGDMGTDESTTYLKALAEGHSDESVRRIANEALMRGNGGAP